LIWIITEGFEWQCPDRNIMRSVSFCSKKIIYITEEIAISAKANAEKRSGVSLRVYQCEKCKCWHLTSQPTKGNNRRELV